jgi:molybdopterin/thiamine biosynthesis adenylyltransferase
MATIRLPEDIWKKVRQHLFSEPGERFAFFLATPSASKGEAIFLVEDVILVHDEDTVASPDGYSVTTEALIEVVNTAVRTKMALVEAHNHGGSRPRFSPTDHQGLEEFVPYVLDSLPGRPYGATVWGNGVVYGEYFGPEGAHGTVRSIVTVSADRLRQLASADVEKSDLTRFDRQLPWFTEIGQRALARLSVGVVGASGTGSPVLQLLELLGVRRFVIVDPDLVDDVNLNRIAYATPADVGSPKTTVGRRFLKSRSPRAEVIEVTGEVQSPTALDALRGVDVLFGCVDNDGARLVLNELALAYRIPYLDVATGLEIEEGRLRDAGGRVAVVVPGGPCLSCMGLIDPLEARYFLDPPVSRQLQADLRYVNGLDAPDPAVGSVNHQVSAIAVNELALWLTGVRAVTPLQEVDLLGSAHATPGQRISLHHVEQLPSCVECPKAGAGDGARLERFYGRQPRFRAG